MSASSRRRPWTRRVGAPALAVTLALAFPVESRAQEAKSSSLTGVIRVRGGGGLPAVAYVEGTPTRTTTADTAVVDQLRLAYVPAVTVVPPGATVEFRNSDPVIHSVFSPSRATGRFDLRRYGPEQVRAHVFVRPGAALILCRIHPEMVAYVFVVEARDWSVTNAEGRFHLEHVPADARELVVWHPRAGTFRFPLPAARADTMFITVPR